MGDEVPLCKVEYTDVDPIEETNWIKRAGNAKVTYPNNHIFEGMFKSAYFNLLQHLRNLLFLYEET